MDTPTSERLEQIRKIVGTALAVFAFVYGSGWIWNNYVNVPDLRYSVLPTYQVAGQHFSGLVLENRGRAPALGVLVKLSALGTPIDALEIQSDELWEIREGGQGEPTAAIWLGRLTSEASITMYLLTTEEVELERSLSIMADRGPAQPTIVSKTPWLALIVAGVVGFGFAGILGFTANRWLIHRKLHYVRQDLELEGLETPPDLELEEQETPPDLENDD